jgi:hypothetical protein
MFYNRTIKLIVSTFLTVILTLGGILPVIGEIPSAYAAEIMVETKDSASSCPSINSSTDVNKVDSYLIKGMRVAHDSTEVFAREELEIWINDLMKRVDDKFLNWYFNYFNQKAMEFGVPFVWIMFKADFLNVLKSKDEKGLKANQIIEKRMINDFQNKFNELVLNPEESQQFLLKLTERSALNYVSALGMKFAMTKNCYNISDQDWEKYLSSLGTLIYNTGNSQSSLSASSLSSKLATNTVILSTAIGGKLALTFASKLAAKIAGKAAGAIMAKISAQILDPVIGLGILIFDVWSYDKMVKQSKPTLRQNILAYFNEVKWSLLNGSENSIMASIKDVESKMIAGLESRSAY